MKKYKSTADVLEDMRKDIIKEGDTVLCIEGEERKGMSCLSMNIDKFAKGEKDDE